MARKKRAFAVVLSFALLAPAGAAPAADEIKWDASVSEGDRETVYEAVRYHETFIMLATKNLPLRGVRLDLEKKPEVAWIVLSGKPRLDLAKDSLAPKGTRTLGSVYFVLRLRAQAFDVAYGYVPGDGKLEGPLASAFLDVDGDQNLDLVTWSGGGNDWHTEVLRNEITSFALIYADDGMRPSRFVDLNGDSRPEIIQAREMFDQDKSCRPSWMGDEVFLWRVVAQKGDKFSAAKGGFAAFYRERLARTVDALARLKKAPKTDFPEGYDDLMIDQCRRRIGAALERFAVEYR